MKPLSLRPLFAILAVSLVVSQAASAQHDEGFLEVATLDTDEDGVPDAVEIFYLTNPFDPDTDGDGVDDGDEISNICVCDPSDVDSNDDGICDGYIDVTARCEARPFTDEVCGRPPATRGDVQLSGSGACSNAGATPLGWVAFLALAARLRRRRTGGAKRQPRTKANVP